jgi:hypothetical protein
VKGVGDKGNLILSIVWLINNFFPLSITLYLFIRRNEKNERLKPLENFATMRVCKGLSKMSFKKAVKVAQIVKV